MAWYRSTGFGFSVPYSQDAARGLGNWYRSLTNKRMDAWWTPAELKDYFQVEDPSPHVSVLVSDDAVFFCAKSSFEEVFEPVGELPISPVYPSLNESVALDDAARIMGVSSCMVISMMFEIDVPDYWER